MAKENWSNEVRAAVPPPPFRPDLVEKIYAAELGGGAATQRLKRVMLLEISQYLENYLWPNFDAATATPQHVLSILLMVNEKFRENVPAWDCFDAAAVGADALPAQSGPAQRLYMLVCSPQRRYTPFMCICIMCACAREDGKLIRMSCDACCRRWRLQTRGSRKQRGSRRSA